MKKPNGKKKAEPAPEPEPEPEPEMPTPRELLATIETRKSEVQKAKRENAVGFDTALSALDAEAEPLELEIRRQETEALVAAIPTLLTLVPLHSRTTCSDDDACNNDGRCRRCLLLYLSESEWAVGDYRVSIDVEER